MRKGKIVILFSILLFTGFLGSLGFAKEEKRPTETMTGSKPVSEKRVETIRGNIVCLLPDYKKGNVKPVIANEPCDKLPPHQHVVVTEKGEIYSIEGSDESILKLQKNPHRRNVKIRGEVEDFGLTKTIRVFGVQLPVGK